MIGQSVLRFVAVFVCSSWVWCWAWAEWWSQLWSSSRVCSSGGCRPTRVYSKMYIKQVLYIPTAVCKADLECVWPQPCLNMTMKK